MSDDGATVSIFASPHLHEVNAVIDCLSSVGIPSVWAQGKALAALGAPVSRGGPLRQVTHVLVASHLAVQARTAIDALPFASRPEPPSSMSVTELRRGHRTMLILAVAALAWIAFVVFGNPEATFRPLYLFLQRLLGS